MGGGVKWDHQLNIRDSQWQAKTAFNWGMFWLSVFSAPLLTISAYALCSSAMPSWHPFQKVTNLKNTNMKRNQLRGGLRGILSGILSKNFTKCQCTISGNSITICAEGPSCQKCGGK